MSKMGFYPSTCKPSLYLILWAIGGLAAVVKQDAAQRRYDLLEKLPFDELWWHGDWGSSSAA